MFRKYEKTYRIKIPQFNVKGKFHLSKDELRHLLNGKVVVEEKLDGANTGIIRHKTGFHLQKRGSLVSTSEHEQFQFFHNWASYQNYNKLMKLPQGYTVYGELMYAVHSLYYDRLPDWFLVFDVWNKRKDKWMNQRDRESFCNDHDLHMVPKIYEGHLTVQELFDIIPKKSAFGDEAEGVVVKRYNKKGYIRGKLVRPEFIKRIEEGEHWSKYNIKTNKIII